MATVNLTGLASGFDWSSFIDQIAEASRTPETTMLEKQSLINERNSAFGSIKTLLTTLQTRVDALNDSSLYDSRTTSVSDSTVGSATAADGTALGTFEFNITNLATAARLNGTSNVGSAISDGSNLDTLTLADAGFATAITAGTFTVNGKQVTIETTDTIQDVFDKISTATSGDVTASYDPGTDKITFSGSGEIILGSATDSSNFLQVTKMVNNGTGTITSSAALGGVRSTVSLASSNLATAVSDGGSGEGEFKINGVSITFDASSDSINNILDRINGSTAGVTATYDSINDRFILTNKTTGDIGVAMEDVTGNFLAATGLSAGTIQRGTNLTYTVNGSDELISQSNTITDISSGITGLSVTALKEGTVTVSVGSDTSKIRTAITNFVSAYNSVQSYIDNKTASSTDSTGKVTAGVLASDHDASNLSSKLRSLVFSKIEGLSGAIDQLADLGIQTNGNDNTLSVSDEDALDNALANNLTSVKDFFSNTTSGLGKVLTDWLDSTIGDDGSIATHQDSLTKQSTAIDDQIAKLEAQIEAESERLTAAFIAMETAQSKLTAQLSYLESQIDSWS